MDSRRTRSLQKEWSGRVESWDSQVCSAPAFKQVLSDLITKASPTPQDRVIDLGAGTGFVTLALAPAVQEIIAVDISGPMLEALGARARTLGLSNIRTEQADLAFVDQPPGSLDLIVSSYALHHLTDERKDALVHRMRAWLRPGGRVVIADMTFGRGGSARDRQIILQKVKALARKGPGGIWRIAKNAVRFGLRKGTDLPSPPDFWIDLFGRAGFEDVGYRPLVAEAGLIFARAPGDHAGGSPP